MFEAAIERIGTTLVSVFGGEAKDEGAGNGEILEDYELAGLSTGVLVKLAGIEFVLASAHGIWDVERGEIRPAVEIFGGKKHVPFATRWGDSTVLRGFVPDRIVDGYPDPDVSMLELNPERLDRLRKDRRPYEEHEIGFFDPRSPARPLLVSGFPGKRMEDELSISGDYFCEMTPCTYCLASNPDGSHPRCISLRIEPALAGVEGVSGGPVVVPNGIGFLVGLTWAEMPEHEELLCEPVREAIRPLRRHPNPEVVSAANRILARVT